jgi:hypothetical protein
MLKFLFVVIPILIFLPIDISADASFFKKYPGQVSNCGYAVALSPAGNIGVGGLQFENAEKRTLIHGQMDPDGKTTTLYTYDTGRVDDTLSAIVASTDGGFILAGNTTGVTTNRDILLLKVRPNGTIAWRKRITTANHEIVYGITRADGGYILVGANAISGNVDALLVKITESGAIVWKKSYGDSDAEFGFSVASTDEGGLIMAGVKEDSPFILKLDSNGRRLWGRVIPTEIYSANGRISIVKSGEFYFLVGTSSEGGHAHGSVEHTGISVSKISSSGNLFWTKEYFSKDPIVVWNATAGINGNVLIAGHAGALTLKALLFEINPDGKFRWKRAYHAENSSAFSVVLTNGNILITGCTGRERLELFVAKSDTQGNIPQACGRWRSITMGADVIQDEIISFTPEEKSFSAASVSSAITTRKMNSGSKDLCTR